MAGAEFKITDAIDPNIVKKLNDIRIGIKDTSSEYANLARLLSEGINLNPGNLKEYREKVEMCNATIAKLHDSQDRLSDLQAGQIRLLGEISRKIELLTKPLGVLADRISEARSGMRGASDDLKSVARDADNASASFRDASSKISMTASDFDSIRKTVKSFDAQAAELNGRLNDNKEEISALRASLRELSKEYRAGAVSEEEYRSGRDAMASRLRTLTEQNRQYSAVLRSHAQVAISTAGSYNEMKSSMLQLEKEYYNLSQAAREGAEGMNILNGIGRLNQQLKEIDAQMGNYQRNVGNYASGWSGLNVSIQQMARELPSLSVSANTFFLAISNNLPMFIDELKNAREEFSRLKKSGQAATPVFKQVLGSLLSWQTALVVGITLLSSYGGEIAEWIGSLFDARKEIDYLRRLQEDLNKAQLDGAKNAQDESVKLDILYRAAVNLNKPMGERKKAVEELKKQYPSYFKNMSDENILAGNAADSYQRLASAIVSSAKARASQDKIIENAKRQLELEAQIEDKYIEQEKAQADLKAAEKAVNDARLLSQDELNRLSMLGAEAASYSLSVSGNAIMSQYNSAKAKVDEIDADLSRLRKEASAIDLENKRIANSIDIGDVTFDPHSTDKATEKAAEDMSSYMEDVRKKIAEMSVSLIEDEHKRNLAAIDKEYNDRMEAIKGHSVEENKLREMYAQERAQKTEEENRRYDDKMKEDEKKRIELKRKETDEMIDMVERESALAVAASDTGFKEMENAVKERYAKGLISRKEYDEEMRGLERKAAEEQIRIQIEAAEKMVAVAEASGAVGKEQIEALRQSIRALKAELGTIGADGGTDDADKRNEETRRNMEALKGYASRLKDLASDIGSPFAGLFDGMDKGFSIMADKISGVWDDLTDGEKFERVTELWSAMAGGIGDVISSVYEGRIKAVEEEQEANEKAGEEEIARIEALEERGAITTEEAEARKRAAEEKTSKRNEELERKKAALRTKQAKFEKMTSIAEAAIQIAGGILQTIKQLGFPAAIPMIAALGAMGAIQLATIIATPIPKYAKGTDSHKGGLAVVGDGGVPETVVTDKGAWITPSVPTLVDIPKGAKVIPYVPDMERMMARASDFGGLMAYRSENDLPPVSVVNDYSGLERKISELEKSQRAGFARLAREIRDTDYRRFSKTV